MLGDPFGRPAQFKPGPHNSGIDLDERVHTAIGGAANPQRTAKVVGYDATKTVLRAYHPGLLSGWFVAKPF